MRLIDLLDYGVTELRNVGISEAELDARILLEYCTGKNRSQIFLDGMSEVSAKVHNDYLQILLRRKNREPVGYILGEQEFWSLPFFITPDVLIPRSETEFLLDRVFALVDPDNYQQGRILDLCCGSGVIAVVLCRELSKTVLALDISSKALQVARRNVRRHCAEKSVEFIQGDLLSPFAGKPIFSLVVSNPPYISSFDLENSLMPEVADHEPHLALDGGERGLDLLAEIRRTLPTVLIPGGQCFIEIGADQGDFARTLFEEDIANLPAFQQVDILVDYAGRDRVVHARLEK